MAECTVTVSRKHLYHWIQDDTVATHQKQNAWCNPCVTLMLPRGQMSPPTPTRKGHLQGHLNQPSLEMWFHFLLLTLGICCCLALSAQKPPNPQVSFTLTENKAEGEAAYIGDSKSQHGGPTKSIPSYESEANSKNILANHCNSCLTAIR